MSKFFEDDAEIVNNESFFEDDAEVVTPEVGQLETAGIAAAQGLTFDFADELAGLLGGTWDYLTSDEKKTLAQEYREDRDAFRRRADLAFQQNPGTYIASDIAGGVVPALLSGGATAVASVGKGLAKGAVKGALKQGIKQGIKTGAKTGAAVGLGSSEADLTKGEVTDAVKDVATGSAIGAGFGAALPVGAEGIKRGYKGAKQGVKSIAKMLPDAELAEAAYQFGKQGKKITEEAVDADLIQTGQKLYNKILNAKKQNNLQSVKDELDALGYKTNIKQAVDDAIDDFEKLVEGDMLNVRNKDIVKKLQDLTGRTAQKAEEELLQKARDRVAIKEIKSANKAKEATIKAEKELAKDQVLSNSEIIDQDDLYAVVDDMPGSVLTKEGELVGKQARFETPEGEQFTKKYLNDATEYQPSEAKLQRLDGGKPVAVVEDMGSGKLDVVVGRAQKEISEDLENMSVNRAEELRSQLNQLIEESIGAGKSTKDPVINRAKLLAAEIKDILDKDIADAGNIELTGKRKTISNLLTAEELIGIKNRLSGRGDIDRALKIRTLADKFGYNKGFKTRGQLQIAEDLLGKDVMDAGTKDQFELLKKVNLILGRENNENISKAGLYKKAVGDLPNVAGRVSSKIEPIVSAPKNIANKISRITDSGLEAIKEKMVNSPNLTIKGLGVRLEKALAEDTTKRSAMLFSLGQTPAFRKTVEDMVLDMDEQQREALGLSDYVEGRETLTLPTLDIEAEAITQDLSRVDSRLGDKIDSSLLSEQKNPLGIEVGDREPATKEESKKDDFRDKIAKRESNGDYSAVNRLGYLGKYQFGGAALQDLGYKKADGSWTGKDGIKSKEDFLKNKEVQEKAFDSWTPLLKRYLNAKGALEYVGKEIDGIKITEKGLMAAAHLVGAGAVSQMLKSGKIPQDANGTKATDYMRMFENDGELDFKQDVLPELKELAQKPDLDATLSQYASKQPVAEDALQKLKTNIMREKADLASGGQGPERVTMDDLLGSIFSLSIQDEELENRMLNAAFEGRLKELEDLIEENLVQ